MSKKSNESISFKLGSELTKQIQEIAKNEGRSWQGQAEWFLSSFNEFMSRERRIRPVPKQIQTPAKNDAYRKLFLPSGLFKSLEGFSRVELISLSELVRQLLLFGCQCYSALGVRGIRKSAFQKSVKELLLEDLSRLPA